MNISIYEVSFAMAGPILLLALSLCTGKRYINISQSNSTFYRVVHVLFLAGLFDIAKDICKINSDVIPNEVFKIAHCFYSVLLSVVVVLSYAYVKAYEKSEISKKHKKSDIAVAVLMIFSLIISIIDVFTDVMTNIGPEKDISFMPAHTANYFARVIIILIIIVNIYLNKQLYTDFQFKAIIAFSVIILLSGLIEILMHEELSVFVFGASIAVMIIQLSLETPDYYLMQQSIREMEISRRDAEEASRIAEESRQEAVEAKFRAEVSALESKKAKDEAEEAEKLAEQAKMVAIKANQDKSEFIMRVAHEFRTPMNSIIGLNEMIYSETTEERIKGYSKDLEYASFNLINIMNDLSDFSKMNRGQVKIECENYQLRSMLKTLYSDYLRKTEEKGIKLIFDIDERLPNNLNGDNLHIRQVIDCLLSNGVKFTSKGTVTLKVTLESKGRSSVLIKFVVKDTGIGIKEEDICKIYDAFMNADSSHEYIYGGSGIGISMVHKLLTMMGSKLNVESVYGLGTQFSFVIRQSFIDPVPIGDFFSDKYIIDNNEIMSEEKELIHASKAKIMVADDNLLNLKVFNGILKDTGIDIISVENGNDAVMMSKQNRFDVIFMDHLMPVMNGIDALKHIKNDDDSLNRETVVIALVANAVKGAYDEYKSYGFDDVLFKPTTLNELNNALWKYLSNDVIDK